MLIQTEFLILIIWIGRKNVVVLIGCKKYLELFTVEITKI